MLQISKNASYESFGRRLLICILETNRNDKIITGYHLLQQNEMSSSLGILVSLRLCFLKGYNNAHGPRAACGQMFQVKK